MVLFSDKKIKWELLWATIIISIMVSVTYFKIIQHPNQFLVAGGDGMKNYYTFMYHIKYDSTYMTFEGMNYPFGENIIFTDNQPLLANTTKILAKIFPQILCNLPAVHNISLLIGLIIGALGLFLCFRTLKVDFIFSILCTLGLILIHPQSTRLHGHFAMFYPMLPWIFYIWLNIWKGTKIYLNSILVGILISLTGLLHMYFFITGAILVCLLFFIWSISKCKKPSFRAMSGMIILQVILPFIILNFFTSYFNYADDRPDSPWGFFTYHSYWEGLFFSYKLPLFDFINHNIIKVRDFDSEGKSYIGIIAVLFCMYGLLSLIFQFKSSIKHFIPSDPKSMLLVVFILSSFISFGWPFTITGLEGLLDYTGPFKQFRSIGRVAWISFYAINLVAIPSIYEWLKNKNWGVKRDILYFAIPTVIILEGVLFYQAKPIQQTPIDAYYCNNNYSEIPVKGSDFQALLPDPYFNIGSECFSWWDQGNNVSQNFELGYILHLPTMGVNMSRTSFNQAFKLNELTCLPYKVPEIIQIIKSKDKRPLLVIETKNELHEQRAKLTHWTKHAPIIYETDQYRLRRLEINMFDTIVKKFTDSLHAINDTIISMQTLDFRKIKGSKEWGYEYYLMKDNTMVGKHSLSYWIECTDASRVHSITEIWQFDGNHQSIDYIGEANRFNYKKYDGNKLLIEIPVFLKPETVKLVFRVSKEKQKENEILNLSKAQLIKK